ncbi:monovalent cation/H(+) antiporter subunit G [Shouchella lonarensis]|uniref:monovalent cation/H(+) antiporter subunit G n=1 Tax=Shouchella lonarensis TaxID=1464122 RepID=UPI000A3D9CB5
MIEWVIIVLVIVGSLFGLLTAVGIIRFPDVYSRLHATGKNATFGVMMIMTATFLHFLIHHGQFIGKVLLTILFVFMTVPISALEISRSAYRTGIPLHPSSTRDEMAPYYATKRKKQQQSSE